MEDETLAEKEFWAKVEAFLKCKPMERVQPKKPGGKAYEQKLALQAWLNKKKA